MTRARAGAVCNIPGCPNDAVDGSRCPDHKPKAWATSNRRQRIGKSGWKLQAEAKYVIARDGGICHVCGRPGADEADHLIPIAEGGSDDLTNKAAIHGDPCHKAKTADESRKTRRRTR